MKPFIFLQLISAFAAFTLCAQQTPEAPPAEDSQPPAAPAEAPAPAEPAADSEAEGTPPKPVPPAIAIEIDLTAQRAWVLQDGQRVYETAISSGRTGHETPPGEFKVVEKDLDHKSSLYGKIVDRSGRVLISDADSDMAVPAGAKFVRAPMKNFLRFNGAVGMHAGRLPGYPASHGCVRLPPSKAALFYNVAEIGTPVRVFGKAPRTATKSRKASNAPSATPPPPPAPKGNWFSRIFNKAPGGAQAAQASR